METEQSYRDQTVLKSKKWKGIYVQYLDKNLSQNEGRKIPKSIAVPNPTIAEVAQALRKLQVHSIVEPNKSYSKNWMVKGRIKAQMVSDEGKELTKFKNKLALLKEIAKIIPQLPNRLENPEGKPLPGSKAFCMEMQMDFTGAPQQQKQNQQDEPSNKKKKGKKGR